MSADIAALAQRSLAIHFDGLIRGDALRIATPTFMSVEEAEESHYALMASPTLFPGQTDPGRSDSGCRQ